MIEDKHHHFLLTLSCLSDRGGVGGGAGQLFLWTLLCFCISGVCACAAFAAPDGTGQLCNCKLNSEPNTFGSAWIEIGILSVFHGCLLFIFVYPLQNADEQFVEKEQW